MFRYRVQNELLPSKKDSVRSLLNGGQGWIVLDFLLAWIVSHLRLYLSVFDILAPRAGFAIAHAAPVRKSVRTNDKASLCGASHPQS